LSAEVSRLPHLVGLNNLFIALKRDNNGPMAIQTIIEEVIEQTKSMKRIHPSEGD